jgi:low affinity Fe/Cu permease
MKFSAVSQSLSRWAGSPRTFYAAVALILVWSLSGPYFHYNDTWQLIINTSTTIITFLMVFLIQNTQNRDLVDETLPKLEERLQKARALASTYGKGHQGDG